MKTAIRKIGNSKGALIPAPLIAACGIRDEVTMHVENNRLIIEAANTKPRKNWFADYDPNKDQPAWNDFVETEAEQADWKW